MNNMKLYPIAQQSLDELQGVSFNSACGCLLLLHILIQLKRMVSCLIEPKSLFYQNIQNRMKIFQ